MKNSLWAKRIRGAGKAVGRQVAMMLVAIVIVMIFLAVSGYDPAAVLQGLGRAFTRDLAGTIRWATPLILAGVAVCIPFKAEVFNLGVDGRSTWGRSPPPGSRWPCRRRPAGWGFCPSFSPGRRRARSSRSSRRS